MSGGLGPAELRLVSGTGVRAERFWVVALGFLEFRVEGSGITVQELNQ